MKTSCVIYGFVMEWSILQQFNDKGNKEMDMSQEYFAGSLEYQVRFRQSLDSHSVVIR